MTSIGTFQTAVDSWFLLHGGNRRSPVIPVLANRRRQSVEVGGSCDNQLLGFSRNLCEDIVGRLSLCCVSNRRPGRWTPKRIEVSAKGTGDAGSEDESEDALQATIEKSKKVLAMQRDLLKQISERRKLVSSIRSSIIDPEGSDEPPYKQSNGSSPHLEDMTIGSDSDENTKPETLSASNLQLATDELKENPPSISREYFGADSKPPAQNLSRSATTSNASSREQLKTTVSEAFQSDEKPSSSLRPWIVPIQKPFEEDSKKSSGDTMVSGQRTSAEVHPDKQFKDASARSAILSKVPSSVKDEKDKIVRVPSLEEVSMEAEEPGAEDGKPPPLAGANVMNIILVAAECAPWSKTGGLGDVAGALPKALARRGHRVMVVAPHYGNYAEPQHSGVRKSYKVDGQDHEVNYLHAYIEGVDFVFIDSPMFRHLENNIYGGNRVDILKRMVLFCKAAIEVPWHVPCGGICYGDGNLVFIANDWHTALLPVYLKAYYRDNGLMKYTRSVLVIHNIAHQGRGPVDDFAYVALPPHYLDLFKLYDPIGGDHFNIFAAGLKAADRVVTVSHGYAWELKTSEGGWGLHGIINENDWKFRGIVNGIDTEDWSPELDVHLQSDGYVNYSLDTLETGKPQCKAALQKELGLPVRDDVPLLAFIGRLDHQKGVDLIAEAVPWMMDQDVQLVMLGTGRQDLEQMLRQFESQYYDKARGWVGFSVKTAHRITAGADILLMPSRFEPCGLNQLYAMRYGTIPVVHAVGGLRDTVKPFNPFEESGLGWTFERAEASQLIRALGNCLLTYRQYKKSWEGLQRRGMMQDLSWDYAAENYEEVLVAAKYQW